MRIDDEVETARHIGGYWRPAIPAGTRGKVVAVSWWDGRPTKVEFGGGEPVDVEPGEVGPVRREWW